MRAGKLRALGLTSAQPNPLTPDVLPIAEHHAGAEAVRRLDLVRRLPAGQDATPGGRRLNAEMKAWLSDPKTLERFTAMAGFPAYGTPEQFDKFVNAQIALWKGVIDKEGLKLDVN